MQERERRGPLAKAAGEKIADGAPQAQRAGGAAGLEAPREADAAALACTADAWRLAGIFMRLPTAEVARGLAEEAVAADAQEVLAGLGLNEKNVQAVVEGFSACRGAEPDGLLDRLRRDYTRLFTNPERPLVSIYEGVFKDTGDFDTSSLVFVSPTALDAERRYREQGLRMDPHSNESADHMGAELDFCCYLCDRAARQAAEGASDAARETLDALDGFMAAHLDKWGAAFFGRVAEHAQTEAYRAVGRLGGALMGLRAAGTAGV